MRVCVTAMKLVAIPVGRKGDGLLRAHVGSSAAIVPHSHQFRMPDGSGAAVYLPPPHLLP